MYRILRMNIFGGFWVVLQGYVDELRIWRSYRQDVAGAW